MDFKFIIELLLIRPCIVLGKLSIALSISLFFSCGSATRNVKAGRPPSVWTNCADPVKCRVGDYSVANRPVASWAEASSTEDVEAKNWHTSGFYNKSFGAMFDAGTFPGVYIFYPARQRYGTNFVQISDRQAFEQKYGKIESVEDFYPRLIGAEYLDPDFDGYVHALDMDHRNKLIAHCKKQIAEHQPDLAVFPEYQEYFRMVRRAAYQDLMSSAASFISDYSYNWFMNVENLRAQREIVLINNTIPKRMKGMVEARQFFYTGNPSEHPYYARWGSLTQYFYEEKRNKILLERIGKQFYSLAIRAKSNNLTRTAEIANILQAQLLYPIGIDDKLYHFLAATDGSTLYKNAEGFVLRINNFGFYWRLEDAVKSYPVALSRARYLTATGDAKRERRFYKTIEIHKETASEANSKNRDQQTQRILRQQLAEVEAKLSATSSGGTRWEAPKGVTGYRCDPGTGLNCRPTYQGGGESASSYYSRKNNDKAVSELMARRDEILQQLAEVKSRPSAGNYDHVTKSEEWHSQTHQVKIEIQQPDGTWKVYKADATAKSKEGAMGAGVGFTPEGLRKYVLDDIRKDIIREIMSQHKAKPVDLPSWEKIKPEQWELALEKCLTGKELTDTVFFMCLKDLD